MVYLFGDPAESKGAHGGREHWQCVIKGIWEMNLTRLLKPSYYRASFRVFLNTLPMLKVEIMMYRVCLFYITLFSFSSCSSFQKWQWQSFFSISDSPFILLSHCCFATSCETIEMTTEGFVEWWCFQVLLLSFIKAGCNALLSPALFCIVKLVWCPSFQ